jgi:hypothetical protein
MKTCSFTDFIWEEELWFRYIKGVSQSVWIQNKILHNGCMVSFKSLKIEAFKKVSLDH